MKSGSGIHLFKSLGLLILPWNEIFIVFDEKRKALLLSKEWEEKQMKAYIIYTHMHTHTHNERISQNSIFKNVIFKENEEMVRRERS